MQVSILRPPRCERGPGPDLVDNARKDGSESRVVEDNIQGDFPLALIVTSAARNSRPTVRDGGEREQDGREYLEQFLVAALAGADCGLLSN